MFFGQASDEERYDLMREGVVIFTGALAKHLEKVELMIPNFFKGSLAFPGLFLLALISIILEQDDPKVLTVVEKLLDVLNTPSESVQRAVSTCLSPLMQSKQVRLKC